MTCSSPPSWPTTRSKPTVGDRVGQNLFGNGILWVRSGGVALRSGGTLAGHLKAMVRKCFLRQLPAGCGYGLSERVAAGGFNAVSRPPSESLAGFVGVFGSAYPEAASVKPPDLAGLDRPGLGNSLRP
jgi:hypothetical protein